MAVELRARRAGVATASSRARRTTAERPARSTRTAAARSGPFRSAAARPRWSIRTAAAASCARATAQSTPTAASAACVGVEQQTALTSSMSVRSTSWPTALMTGTGSRATVRQSASSQNAQRSAIDPPPRVTTIASTFATAASSRICAAMAGAARRSCTGA